MHLSALSTPHRVMLDAAVDELTAAAAAFAVLRTATASHRYETALTYLHRLLNRLDRHHAAD